MYDAVIVGGGAVGLSLALALGQQQYRVLIIEKKNESVVVDDFQARTIALSYASKRIYECLHIWEDLSLKAVPISQVVVSVKGHYGRSSLKTDDHEALGYVVGANVIESVLTQHLVTQPTVEILRPGEILQRECTQSSWQLTVRGKHQPIACKLLVAADGIHSQLRQEQQISTKLMDYNHFAVLANLEMPQMAQETAIERFLPNGAIALLPWKNKAFTCVWTTSQQEALALKNMPEQDFISCCQEQLGKRLGKIVRVSERLAFPLTMNVAAQQSGSRFLLMGNAAHNLHPIAAQGLNLSLRDVWQIRSQLIKAKEPLDIGAQSFLQSYVNERKSDQHQIIFATDKIANFMSSQRIPAPFRALGITLFDSIKPLKEQFTQRAMGF
ncbi:MAG: FAD-dependent monooxygenase [Proteobacteria bacterium]|nr:FAD-dependent monooxygenase [Pseudomonadota bacterium]